MTGENVEDVFSIAGKELFQKLEKEEADAEIETVEEYSDYASNMSSSFNLATKITADRSGGKIKRNKKGCC